MTPVTILLAEDNMGDQKLFEYALKGEEGANLQIVNDGREALRYLRREGGYADAAQPNLVVIDLNLARRNGPEVLEEMRKDPVLADIPVAIFTGAKATEELTKICKLNTSFYAVKPDRPDSYFAIVKALLEYARRIAEFPTLKQDYTDGLRRLLEKSSA